MPSTEAKFPPLEDIQPAGGYGTLGETTKIYATDLYEDGYGDPVYREKARILNRHIQEIGMGKYQVCIV